MRPIVCDILVAPSQRSTSIPPRSGRIARPARWKSARPARRWNFVSESAGMLARLIGVSYEALVIDNDMLGLLQRTLPGIKVSNETLLVDVIREVSEGADHYRGRRCWGGRPWISRR